MHHPTDENTAGDLRHTVGEIWRVLRERRWHLILAFLGASSVALIGSLWVPRLYSSSVILRREQDAVLAGMMGKAGTESYGELRRQMAFDLGDRELVAKVVDNLRLTESMSEGRAARPSRGRESLIEEIVAGVNVRMIDATTNRDVVSISLTLSEPEWLPDILRSLRDEYIETSRQKTREALENVRSFYRAEADRGRARLAKLQREVARFESAHPGINPAQPNPIAAEQAVLAAEKVQLDRQLDEARTELAAIERERAGLCASAETGPAAPSPASTQVANRRYAALQEEIEKIGSEIDENRTLRSMTTQHPSNQRLLTILARKFSELEATPATIPAEESEGNPAAAVSPQEAALAALESRTTEQDGRMAALSARLQQVATRTRELDAIHAGVLEHREEYLLLREALDRTTAELTSCQASIGPVEHLLRVENSNRGVHFTTLRDVDSTLRPSSPDGKVTTGICFGIGAAVAVLIVVLVEITDRSFRTARGLASSLGVPVIESIDEILTATMRRRRLFRRLLVMPTIAVLLLATTVYAGAMAFFSLERPRDYETIRHSPTRLYDVCFSETEEP